MNFIYLPVCILSFKQKHRKNKGETRQDGLGGRGEEDQAGTVRKIRATVVQIFNH